MFKIMIRWHPKTMDNHTNNPQGDAFDRIITTVEKAMVTKPLNTEDEVIEEYMAGYLKGLFECGIITDLQYDFLYMRYAQGLF